MVDLRVEAVGSEETLRDWQHVHNVIIPADELSLDEIRDRATRYVLEVAYQQDVLVGCTTVRPGATATVIARVLKEHRRQGIGEALYIRAVEQARALGAVDIETIVLASNVDGVRFAHAHGFTEVDRYLPEGDEFPYITLRLG